MNIFQDQTGNYLLAVNATTGTWDISTLGLNLDVTNTIDTGIASNGLGWGFSDQGNLFLSSVFNSNVISYQINESTGSVTPVSFTLPFAGTTNYYISNTVYDPTSDTLYIYNSGNEKLYSLADASANFGLSDVPEPAMLFPSAPILAVLFSRKRIFTAR